MKNTLRLFAIFAGLALITTAQAQSFLTNGLIAFYPFNGNAHDESGNGYNGEVRRAFSWPDRQGNANAAYVFRGNGWIHLPTSLLENRNEQGSVSLWFVANAPNTPQLEDIFAACGDGSDSGIGAPNRIYLQIVSGRVLATIGNPSKDIYSPPIAAQKWYQACLVWNNGGDTAVLYLNGVKIGQISSIVLKPSISFVNLGSWKQEGGFFHGAIDDFRIFNRALSDDEVMQLYDFENQSSVQIAPLPTIKSSDTTSQVKPSSNNFAARLLSQAEIQALGEDVTNQFIAFTNGDDVFTGAKIIKIEPSAITIIEGSSGGRYLLRDFPEAIQNQLGYSESEAQAYEGKLQRQKNDYNQAYAAQSQQLAQTQAAEQQDLQETADNVQTIKGTVIQLVGGGILVSERGTGSTFFVINYPGNPPPVDFRIIVSAVNVGSFDYKNAFNASVSATKFDAKLPHNVVDYLKQKGVTLYPSSAYP